MLSNLTNVNSTVILLLQQIFSNLAPNKFVNIFHHNYRLLYKTNLMEITVLEYKDVILCVFEQCVVEEELREHPIGDLRLSSSFCQMLAA